MVSSLLHLADALWHNLGEEGHEGHDGGPRHELRDLVDAFVDGLELLLLGVQPPARRDGPKNVDDGYVDVVADGERLAHLPGH